MSIGVRLIRASLSLRKRATFPCGGRAARESVTLVKPGLSTATTFLPTVHGFDEFFDNLYQLNAEDQSSA